MDQHPLDVLVAGQLLVDLQIDTVLDQPGGISIPQVVECEFMQADLVRVETEPPGTLARPIRPPAPPCKGVWLLIYLPVPYFEQFLAKVWMFCHRERYMNNIPDIREFLSYSESEFFNMLEYLKIFPLPFPAPYIMLYNYSRP